MITIDGPAGSGKTTTAKEVARRLGFRHLDSGALYRAATVAVLRAGIPATEWDTLSGEVLAELEIRLVPSESEFHVLVGGEEVAEDLRSAETTHLAPRLAKNYCVRKKLSNLQRSAVSFGDLVTDGRDMGTVVFPDAGLKVFLTASLLERSRRRLLEEHSTQDERSVREEAARIKQRDETDAGREIAPLRKPEGALEIDTTEMTVETQVAEIVAAASVLTRRAAEE